jgi:hypothetical protein
MSTAIKRSILDIRVTNYTQKRASIEILDSIPEPWKRNNPNPDQRAPTERHKFIQRWYLGLQGEDSPQRDPKTVGSTTRAEDNLLVYRYDWTLGITVVEGHWWDWQKELQEDEGGCLALHLLLQPMGDKAPEAIPLSASLSVLYPSRNRQTFREDFLKAVTKTGSKASEAGGQILPALKFLQAGFDVGENFLESSTGKKKNWFLYQFLDENYRCPAVEWRISKRVLTEFGSLLRGSVHLAFHDGDNSGVDPLRLTFRPQIRYSPGDLEYIVPTNALGSKDKQVFIDVKPQ